VDLFGDLFIRVSVQRPNWVSGEKRLIFLGGKRKARGSIEKIVGDN